MIIYHVCLKRTINGTETLDDGIVTRDLPISSAEDYLEVKRDVCREFNFNINYTNILSLTKLN